MAAKTGVYPVFENKFKIGTSAESLKDVYKRQGRYLPTQGCWDRTAGQLIEALTHCGGDIGAVVGDYDPEDVYKRQG